MALTELLFRIRKAEIGSITLDAAVRETHRASAKATDHPVETEAGEASVVSDHIHVDPLNISIEGVITNTPAEIGAVIQQTLSGSFDPAGDAHKQMLEDLLGRRLVTVVTTLKTYKDMALEGISVDRNAQKGNALYFTAEGKQIRKVTTKTVEVKAPEKATKAAGKKPTKPPAPKAAAKSISLAKKLTGYFGR